MNLIVIGVICIAIIGVACLYFGKDGAIISTIIALIAGAAGFGVKKAKDELVPGSVNVPITQTNPSTNEMTIEMVSQPVKVPKISGTQNVDFVEIMRQVDLRLVEEHSPITAMNRYSQLQNRAGAARVGSLDEVKQWNEYLIKLCTMAVHEMLPIAEFGTMAEMDSLVKKYTDQVCVELNQMQKTVLGWLKNLYGQKAAIGRLEVVGLDWSKLTDTYKSAWYIAELAYNPIVQIGITSEDIVV